MKKLLTITVLMALAVSGFAQILHYDFSAVCETGQTLYYLITSEEEQTVMLTHPFSEENPWFTGDNYYDGFPEPQGEIILPTIIYYNDNPYSVTAIGDNAFNNCRDLAGTLTIPEGILSIGSRAFRSCGFTSIIIPQSLEVIVSQDFGYGTPFVYCGSLESISVDDENPIFYSENNAIIRRDNKTLVAGCKTTTIPDDIETIGCSAFQGSGDGGDLVIPNSVTAINDYAFYESQFSGTITLSDSLRYIGVKAFSYCHISGSLTIPSSVTEIGNYAFSDCSHLTGNLTLSSSLSAINHGVFQHVGCTGTLIIPNSVNYIDDLAFYFTNFSELVLGDSVSTIGNDSFNNLYSDIHLTGVLRLPISLTEMGREAFAYNSFDEIYSPNRIPPTLVSNTFNGNNPTTPIRIPFGCTEAYQNASGWNYFHNFIEEEPIIFTEFEPDTCFTLNYQDTIYWDLNQDGAYDIYFYLVYHSAGGYMTYMSPVTHWQWSNSIKIDQNLWQPLTDSSIIDESLYWQSGELFFSGMDSPEWWYFAFRHQTEDGIHYGWAHIKCTGYCNFCISGMGYCTIPNYPIVWGQTTITTGLEEETIENDFSVYPNPTSGVLFVETFQETSLPNQTYRIINMMGQTLLHGNITAKTQQIIIENLPAGLYFISVGNVTQKFVVK